MNLRVLARAGLVIATIACTVALGACVHASPGATDGAVTGIDPDAPAAPAEPQQEAATNSGSDNPVVVDPMLKDESPSQATRDYSEAFNANPDYKPAASRADTKARGTGSRLMVVGVPRINIRSAPDRRSHIVGELRRGDTLMVDIDESIGWAKINEGEYIRARHLRDAKSPEN